MVWCVYMYIYIYVFCVCQYVSVISVVVSQLREMEASSRGAIPVGWHIFSMATIRMDVNSIELRVFFGASQTFLFSLACCTCLVEGVTSCLVWHLREEIPVHNTFIQFDAPSGPTPVLPG